jgi:hypothetical protein
MRNVFKILVWKPQVKRPFVRLWHKQENNTNMGLRETRLQDVLYIKMVQNMVQWWALVNITITFKSHKTRNFLHG